MSHYSAASPTSRLRHRKGFPIVPHTIGSTPQDMPARLEPLEPRVLLSVAGGVNTNLWISLGDALDHATKSSKDMAELVDQKVFDYIDKNGAHHYSSYAQAKTSGGEAGSGDYTCTTDMKGEVTNFDGTHWCRAEGDSLLEWFADVVPIKDLPDIISKSAIKAGGLEIPVLWQVDGDVSVEGGTFGDHNVYGTAEGKATISTMGSLTSGMVDVHDMDLHGDSRVNVGVDSRTDYGKATVRYIPLMWRSGYVYFYFQATSTMVIMPPAGGAGTIEAKATMDPVLSFDQATFDQVESSLGVPTFNLSDYFSLHAAQSPSTPAADLDVSKPDLVAASDTGPSSTDDITGDTTPTFTGTVVDPLAAAGMQAPSLAILYVDGVEAGRGQVKNGVYTITSSHPLAPSTHSVMVTAGPSASYQSMPSEALSITIDTSLPGGSDQTPPAGQVIAGGDLTLGAGGLTSVTFTDSDGTTATIGLSAGAAAVHFAGDNPVQLINHGMATMTGSNIHIAQIDLSGDTSKATLSFQIKNGLGSDGHISLGGLTSSGAVKTISAAKVDLAGNLVLAGGVGALTLGDVTGPQHTIALGGTVLDKGPTLVLGDVADLTMTSAAPIQSLTVQSWLDTGSDDVLTASALGKLTCGGDFMADLVLGGSGVPQTQNTLGTAMIAGSVRDTSWTIHGSAGVLAVNGVVQNWTLQGAGAAGAGLSAVKSLTLGDVHDVTILADGAFGPVKALNWDGGAIAADSLASLAVTGRKAVGVVTGLPGNFTNANLTLRADAAPAVGKATITALGSATIAGGLSASTWAIDMDAGAISAAGAVSGWTLAGADNDADGAAPGLLSVKSLTLGAVANASVTVKAALLPVTSALHQVSQANSGGVLGAVKALRWDVGAIEAESLTSLAITGRKFTPTAGAVAGSFRANVTLHGGNLAPRKPTAGAVSIAADLDTSQWLVTGSMTSLTVTGTATGSTVRASGTIASITLGATTGSNFLAGVITAQLDPAAVTSADLEPTHLATIGSISVKGLTGVPAESVATSGFLAPCLGTVSLLNAALDTSDLYALPGPTVARIKTVTLKDTRSPKDPAHNWTWTPAKNVPADAGGMANRIPAP